MSHQQANVSLICGSHLVDNFIPLPLLFSLCLLLFLDGRFCIKPGGQFFQKHGGLGVYRPVIPMEDAG